MQEVPDRENKDLLWLDDKHYIYWVVAYGNPERKIGGILGHTSDKSHHPEGWCEGAFWFDTAKDVLDEKYTFWQFNDDFEKPTLTPSFLCHCKECHIFIRDGKVVDAGCTH